MPVFTHSYLFVQQIFAECLRALLDVLVQRVSRGEAWLAVLTHCREAPSPVWPQNSSASPTGWRSEGSPTPAHYLIHACSGVWNRESVRHDVMEPNLRQKEPLLTIPSHVGTLPTRGDPHTLSQFRFLREKLIGSAGVTCSLLIQSAVAMGGWGHMVQKVGGIMMK